MTSKMSTNLTLGFRKKAKAPLITKFSGNKA